MSTSFNESFKDKGEKPRFMYKKNPLAPHSYQIFEFKPYKNAAGYEPVGEYIVLETEEDPEITEKKVMNVVSLLNGKDNLIDLSEMVDSRLLFQMVPRTNDQDPTKIIFRTHDGDGTSTENAVFTIEKGVINEQQ